MHSTDSDIKVTGYKGDEEDIYIRFRLCFYLHASDAELLTELLPWFNEKMEAYNAPKVDEADFLLTLITGELHRLKSEKDGKPYVLRKDRKKPQA